jgi:hypothetical protein
MIVSKMGVAKLHNEKFDNSYSLPRIIRMFIRQSMSWEGCITHMRKSRNVYKILVTKASRKIHFSHLGRDGSKILKWNFNK